MAIDIQFYGNSDIDSSSFELIPTKQVYASQSTGYADPRDGIPPSDIYYTFQVGDDSGIGAGLVRLASDNGDNKVFEINHSVAVTGVDPTKGSIAYTVTDTWINQGSAPVFTIQSPSSLVPNSFIAESRQSFGTYDDIVGKTIDQLSESGNGFSFGIFENSSFIGTPNNDQISVSLNSTVQGGAGFDYITTSHSEVTSIVYKSLSDLEGTEWTPTTESLSAGQTIDAETIVGFGDEGNNQIDFSALKGTLHYIGEQAFDGTPGEMRLAHHVLDPGLERDSVGLNLFGFPRQR